jgi:hypothetical protein
MNLSQPLPAEPIGPTTTASSLALGFALGFASLR